MAEHNASVSGVISGQAAIAAESRRSDGVHQRPDGDSQQQGPSTAHQQEQPDTINNNDSNNNGPPQQQQQANNQFGTVRDRIFQAMLVRMAVCYNRYIPKFVRRLIEFFTLLTAISLLCIMLYVHFSFGRKDPDCLASLINVWPRDGVLRVEVINNWEEYNAYQERLADEALKRDTAASNSTAFDLKEVLIKGPKALPKELRRRNADPIRRKSDHWSNLLLSNETVFDFLWKVDKSQKHLFSHDDISPVTEDADVEAIDDELFDGEKGPEATYECVIEYSLHNGLLRLSDAYRVDHNIPFLRVRIDPETDGCFGDVFSRFLMRHFLGFEDVLMSSVKSLAGNETEKGFLKDMITGELYRFVPSGHSRISYVYAFFVMLIFTFAISMLLRFSHYQIFIFIVDLLQIFDQNSIMAFPAAPLLTVIMALFGMETIMREIFNDTSTGFYVILLVWIADQYDSICCHAPISKRHWLRFFYLYHFAFYAYHYRFNGQYGGLALLTSTFFILHSMIYFFHHYEMPLILYRERIQRIIENIQDDTPEPPQPGEMADAATQNSGQLEQLSASTNREQSTTAVNGMETTRPIAGSMTGFVRNEGSQNTLSQGDHFTGGNTGSVNHGSASLIGAAYGVRTPTQDLTEQFLAAEQTAREVVANAMNDLF